MKFHMRCRVSQMFTDNKFLNVETIMSKMSNFMSSSDNAIIQVLMGNIVARERMSEYWYGILY